MQNYPRTVEDLASSESWMKKMRTAIRRYNLPEDVDDILCDVLCLMLQRKKEGKNYIERWEPTLGSYSNWIYTFVNNVCRKKYTKSRSRCGTALRTASSIVQGDREESSSGEINERYLPHSDPKSVDFQMQVRDVIDQLQGQKAHSWVEYSKNGYTVCNSKGEKEFHEGEVDSHLEGTVVERNLSTVFSMMVDGMEPKDIAVRMKTSPTFVYSLIRKLRSVQELQSWKSQVIPSV